MCVVMVVESFFKLGWIAKKNVFSTTIRDRSSRYTRVIGLHRHMQSQFHCPVPVAQPPDGIPTPPLTRGDINPPPVRELP